MARQSAGMAAYLGEAFRYRWNLLGFFGALGFAALSGSGDVIVPLVLAAELTYLGGLVSIPRFRAAIDAKRAGKVTGGRSPKKAQKDLGDSIKGLGYNSRTRFTELRKRCLEMQDIALGVRGVDEDKANVNDLRLPALNRLLWVFLRLLQSQESLQRFLQSTDRATIQTGRDEARARLDEAPADERVERSLRDTLATAELRLENYDKAAKDAEFVALELDRIEAKIRALTEMNIHHQDPDYITRQVDSVAESMRHTEEAISEIHQITGIQDELEDPPELLNNEELFDAQ